MTHLCMDGQNVEAGALNAAFVDLAQPYRWTRQQTEVVMALSLMDICLSIFIPALSINLLICTIKAEVVTGEGVNGGL